MVDIREFVEGLSHERGLTRDGLAKALGYKSKTSLVRIMNGEANAESMRKFAQAVRRAFPLTEDEESRLSAAVDIAVYGRDKYHAFHALWDFIQGRDIRASGDGALHVIAAQRRKEIDLVDRYGGAKDVQLTVVNCQYVNGLFDIAGELLQSGNATMEHFIYVDGDDARTIQAVRSLMAVLYRKGYMGYTRIRRQAGDEEQDCGLNDADLMFVSWRDETQAERTDAIVFSDPRSGCLLEVPVLDEWTLEKMGLDRRQFRAIKREYFKCSAFSDYEKYSEDYAALERDRVVWKIKPDVGVDQIPAWILRKAVQEGVGSADAGFNEVLDRLERIYADRYGNTIGKRKHAYTIFKRGAMRRFALTGKTTDHFWMMRPYTPEERCVILRALLEQQFNNPYAHMFFLKEDSALRDVEIAYYEGEGMLILESDTDYNLQKGHSEVLITHQRLLDLYREFFMSVLLKEYTFPESETISFLRQLILEAERLRET